MSGREITVQISADAYCEVKFPITIPIVTALKSALPTNVFFYNTLQDITQSLIVLKAFER